LPDAEVESTVSQAPAPLHPHALEPAPPMRPLPALACDAHAHVFGPYARFPLSGERSYSPPEAPLETYLAMLERVGFRRGVLVHASAYGADCSALLDGLGRGGSRLRGIAVATAQTSEAELETMQRLGVRGLRFTHFDDPAVQARFKGSVGFDDLARLAPRMQAHGLHAQIWSDADTIAAAAARLLALGVPLVLDHMGRFEVERGTEHRAFQTLLGLLREGRIWVKLSANRNAKRPDYADVRPFHDALLRANPAQLLWGSDWPFLGMADATPHVGQLVDLLHEWTTDAGLRERILVANPAELYQFADAD
jgi:2-pyrone-4,6-dicarboxylate lactonase